MSVLNSLEFKGIDGLSILKRKDIHNYMDAFLLPIEDLKKYSESVLGNDYIVHKEIDRIIIKNESGLIEIKRIDESTWYMDIKNNNQIVVRAYYNVKERTERFSI